MAVAYRNERSLVEGARWVDYTRDTIGQLDGLQSSLKDAETGCRGYLLTGRGEYLEPYHAGLVNVGTSLQRLGALPSGDARHRSRVANIRTLVATALAEMRDAIAARDTKGLQAGADAVTAGRGKAAMDSIRAAIARMKSDEVALLQLRTATSQRAARTAQISLVLVGALLFAFLALIWALIRLDLMKRFAAERELRLSETELRTTLRSIGDAVVACDGEGRITLMNPIAEGLTGWAEGEARGRPAAEILRLIHESDRTEVPSPLARALTGAPTSLEHRTILRSRTGAEYPIADSASPIRNEKGETRGAVLVFRDITEKRQAERELQRLAAIVSSSEDAIVAEGLDGTVTTWNAGAERLFGYTAAEVVGRPVSVLDPPGSDESTQSRLVRIGRGERVQQFDTTRLHRDGRRLEVSVSISPIRSADGVLIGASKIFRDIRQRKESEAALRSSEERFRVLSNAVPSFVWVSEEGRGATFLNRRWYEYTGRTEKDSLGDGWTGAIHPDDAETVRQKWEYALASGEPFETELRYRRKDGEHRWFVARAIRAQSGGRRIWIATATDIDDLKNTAAALRAAKEAAEHAAEAKDRFLAVLSHELRTPLTPALATSQLLERRTDVADDVREALQLLRRNIELEALLVDDLLDLNKITRGLIELRKQPVDLHGIVENVADICRSELLTKGQHLEIDLRAREHHGDADSARMQQVLWNLLKNAIKFTPVGGSISIGSDNPRPGQIALTVSDSGVGIPAGVMGRIFEPFEQGPKTLSPRSGGLGLGLSISKKLVELHDGTIRARSEGEGRGATFTVELRAFRETRVALSAGAPAPSATPKKLSILLVEDHGDTAVALSQILREEGHQVATAGSASDAVATFRERPFDLLITDLGLPDASGRTLLGSLREIRPVSGIVISGYGMDSDVAKSREAGFEDHLTKPVHVDTLLAAIDRISAQT